MLLLVLCQSIVSFGANADPDSPEAERATFKVADGFDVQLFASEADGIVKPIQMRFDAQGRLWVTGSHIYPQIEPGQKPDDKIWVLEDADHDGKLDKTTVFADGLTIPTGIEIGDGGVYLGHGTQMLHLKDTDGDGKADQRRVVLSGFGTGDTHQNINSFMWGPGGELWFCQGLSIRSRVETPWGIVNLDKAGIWRFYPRRLKLEPFFGGEEEPQNPWGYAFTEWGEPIVIAGNYSSINYPVPYLVPNRKRAQVPLIWHNGNARKCSGGDIVGNAHFPKSWQGMFIVGGYLNNAVWALKMLDDGSGFAVEDRAEGPLIASTSQSFRPVDVKFGPDGALYVCDWYNTIIGHYQNSFWDKRRDRSHGRIWRVTAKGKPLTKAPRLADASIPELLDQLKSNDLWVRHFAKRVLADRPVEEVTKSLRDWTAQDGRSDLELKEALGVYQSHEVVEPKLLARLCRAKNPGARAYAASVVGAWADRLPDPLGMLRPLVSDENARVRLHAIVSCTYVPKPESIELALTAADYPTDAFIDFALNQAVYSLKPQWLEPFKAGKLSFENKPARVGTLVKDDGTPDTRAAVRQQVARTDLDAATRETFFRILADVGDNNDVTTILAIDDPAMLGRLLPAVAEAAELRHVQPTDPAGRVSDLLGNPDDTVRIGAIKLAAACRLAVLYAQIEQMAQAPTEREPVRRAATEALWPIFGDASRDTLTKLADGEPVAGVRASAIAGLSMFDLPAAADRAATFLAGGAPDLAAEDVVRAITKRADGAAALAKSMSAKPPTADAAKIALRVMSATGQRDDALAEILEKAAGLTREAKQVTESEIAALAQEVRVSGDAVRGAQVFQRPEMSCGTCHAVNGKGGHIGPDLGNVGTAQTIEFIIGAVLLPNREVKEGFVAHDVVTKRGERYQGYILREDATELLLRDIAQDKPVRLRKDSIAKRIQRGSPMPPGLTDTLTRGELRDLIRYLGSLGQARVGTN